MPIHDWSDNILIVELNDEPRFSEDMESLDQKLGVLDGTLPHIIANLNGVKHINSSNIAQLLKLRKFLLNRDARLRICAIDSKVWSVFLTTGLDQIFEFTEDVSTSLASLQMGL